MATHAHGITRGRKLHAPNSKEEAPRLSSSTCASAQRSLKNECLPEDVTQALNGLNQERYGLPVGCSCCLLVCGCCVAVVAVVAVVAAVAAVDAVAAVAAVAALAAVAAGAA